MAATDWDGTTLNATGEYGTFRHGFADAARDGRWDAVFAELAKSPSLVNTWRPGGPSWFTPLHQAAWHGADQPVVLRLLTHRP